MQENQALEEQVAILIETRDFRALRTILLQYPPADVAEFISDIAPDDKAVIFRILPQDLATESFGYLDHDAQESLIGSLGSRRVAKILNDMSADDRTAFLEECPSEVAKQMIMLLTTKERDIALSLLGYPENSVGRLMTPDYLFVRMEWSVEQVLSHIREFGRDTDMVNVLYALDNQGKLVDDIRIRDVLLASPTVTVQQLCRDQCHSLNAYEDNVVAVDAFKKYDRSALPVVDLQNHMLGIVTVDDVLDVAEEEATEDFQKIAGMGALEEPFIRIPILRLVGKRAPWLIVLLIGQMFTASAMGYFQDQIARAVALALFIPLIISSGGNSGSQAATLVIRAISLGEVDASDWLRVVGRELISGILLGAILAFIGFARIALWSSSGVSAEPAWQQLGLIVASSVFIIVLWGSLIGALFPIILHRLGFDPATSSAPFVATVVDVTGVVIYFTIGSFVLATL
jgi:magnesium transporter